MRRYLKVYCHLKGVLRLRLPCVCIAQAVVGQLVDATEQVDVRLTRRRPPPEARRLLLLECHTAAEAPPRAIRQPALRRTRPAASASWDCLRCSKRRGVAPAPCGVARSTGGQSVEQTDASHGGGGGGGARGRRSVVACGRMRRGLDHDGGSAQLPDGGAAAA